MPKKKEYKIGYVVVPKVQKLEQHFEDYNEAQAYAEELLENPKVVDVKIMRVGEVDDSGQQG